jgi:A/G-specific adenine glycosylase
VTTSGADRPLGVTPRTRRALRAIRAERELPWRATRDPWKVLVAEFCCQQTQAARAVAAYERCCERFPTPRACAEASLRDVLAAWKGLGYYRRARALHDAARVIVSDHGGEVPRDLAALLGLPGVGPYTARAVLAFAFEADVAVVDTNVARVLARALAGRPLTAAEAQRLADAAVEPGRSWEHNQAMIDLGALVCRPTPRCERCSLRGVCRWNAAGRPAPDPAHRSAGVSVPQAAFAGSDRQGRGRLLAAALEREIPRAELAAVAGWPDDPARAARVADRLVDEGLFERLGAGYRVLGDAAVRTSGSR